MKSRQDAWTHDDDLLLAETVLRHIRDGSTQVAAFDEVGDQLNRTSAACGYRWNAEVRGQYLQAVEHAKKEKKEKKRLAQSKNMKLEQVQKNAKKNGEKLKTLKRKSDKNEEIPIRQETIRTLTLDDCIDFLQNYPDRNNLELRDDNKRLKLENQKLKKKNEELRLKYEQSMQHSQKIEHDYKLLMSILNQAKNMSELAEESCHNIH
ncbi:RsfA family transcriptional regulator [Metabacillus sediminilitoris]|uniref:RsfA family transcriptional regulator n=1 Tax=Metabacillus sediminilitoris TaxID=2567941 RepID=A0A4S4C7N2_9BACI|nr:RsfA family transcriptional regulator [Metabacillus sediminilitoris]THF81809.1 RsfA family transcriptional regulator [Metabacillus sediminilitoris]